MRVWQARIGWLMADSRNGSQKKGVVMSQSSSSSSGGIGFAGLLTIVFVTLKLLDKIDWSWWWVLSPLWIGFAILFAILFGVGSIFLVSELKKKG